MKCQLKIDQYSVSELASKLRQGDEQAFELIFRTYFIPITNYITKITVDEEVSKEIAQDLFFDMWKKRRLLNFHPSLKAYLYFAARNRALNYKRNYARIDHLTDELEEIESPENTMDLEFLELSNVLYGAIDNLPEPSRRYFILSRKNNLTYLEIAEKMQVSVKTVEYHISKALATLRKVIVYFFIFFI